MPTREQVYSLCLNMGLSPYQIETIVNNHTKYDVRKIVKHNGIVLVPYRADGRDWRERGARLVRGPRADLLGSDRPLAIDRRGFKRHANGFSLVHGGGVYHFTNAFGIGPYNNNSHAHAA